MKSRRNLLAQADEIRDRAVGEGWTQPALVQALVDMLEVSWLRAHRLARGWTLRDAVIGLRGHAASLTSPPHVDEDQLGIWETHPERRPRAGTIDLLCQLYQTDATALGFTGDYSTDEATLPLSKDAGSNPRQHRVWPRALTTHDTKQKAHIAQPLERSGPLIADTERPSWGTELRALREARGLSLRQLAASIPMNHGHLGRIERGERPATGQAARRLDQALNGGGLLLRLWEREGSTAKADSDVASPVAPVAKPLAGLAAMQAEREGSVTGEVIVPCRTRDGKVRFMPVSRRALLASGTAGLMAAALMPHSAAGAPRTLSAGGPTPVEHYRAARRVLVQADNLLGPRQVIQAVQQSLAALRTLREQASGQDALDLLELHVRYAEFAGWLAQDLGDMQSASMSTDKALQWAHAHGDADLISYVLGRKSQLAADTGDAMDAVDLAEASQRGTRPDSGLRAIGEMHRAHGLALRGRELEALRAYDSTLDMITALNGNPTPWGSWLDEGYVRVQRAWSLHVLGHHDQAAQGLTDALAGLPTTYERDRGVYLARAASAHAGMQEPEMASALGQEATEIARVTGSARIIGELAVLDAQLTKSWPKTPATVEFRAALDAIVHHEA
ncbi:multiprotein-bridging factor 1 family protein [Streptomyces xiamenensis]|uniref:helix-turn-helix domain-containing protein n=1 Tax=Streptomyces xiamenensis TaxID=408015 RepID=UPI0036ED04EC